MADFRLHFKKRLLPIVFAQTFGVACGVAGVKVTSSLVTPADLGLFGVLLTFTTTGMWIVHAGLINFVSRHWDGSPDRGALLHELIRAWLRKLPWLAGVAIVAGTVIQRPFAAVGIFAAASLLSLLALAQHALQAARQHWRDCGVAVGASLSRTFFPPLLYFAAGGLWTGLWLGFVGHAIVAVLAGAWALQRYWRKTLVVGQHEPQLTTTYSGPLFITLAIASWILSSTNRWLVAANFGAIETGYFMLAGNAALIVPTVIGATFLQFFRPGLFETADRPGAISRHFARFWDWVATTYFVSALLALIALDWLAPFLVGPLINSRYADALVWILPAGTFGIATNTALFYRTLLLAGHREKACGPVDLSFIAVMIAGCTITAAIGRGCFMHWLLFTPVVPWVLTRPLARHFLFKPGATPASAAVR